MLNCPICLSLIFVPTWNEKHVHVFHSKCSCSFIHVYFNYDINEPNKSSILIFIYGYNSRLELLVNNSGDIIQCTKWDLNQSYKHSNVVDPFLAFEELWKLEITNRVLNR